MPARKSARQSVRRADRNRSARTANRTTLARALETIYDGDVEQAEPAVLAALSGLDRAVQKGVLHKNNASRHKSRLTIKLNRLREGGIEAVVVQGSIRGRQASRRSSGRSGRGS